MVRTCPDCGCSDIDEDAARGDATCMGCGTVLEESIVVSENQFQERSGGSGHTLIGQFISIERAQTHTLPGVPGLVSQESREVTYQRGRKLIEEVASQLRINQHCMDTAFNFFKMCVSRNLTRGRVRSHVVAACLYMTCRLENTAHLLLDFSDVTQVNVFDLGRTLNFLSRSLRINLPSTDPCLYIMRFACMLEFGDKQKDVVNLATRLVQRMKRDWMSTGRRPTGLCGAALLLAARSYNFNRTISDVVKVVHISESVVRKRLEEFSQTPSSALTIDEFVTVDLEHSEDPPAFREARRKAREQQLIREAAVVESMEKDIHPMELELEKALERKRREKFKHTQYAKLVAGNFGEDSEFGSAEEALLRNEIMDSVYSAADAEPSTSQQSTYQRYGPSLHSLGICKLDSNKSTYFATPALPQKDRPDGELDLNGIDDDEIDSYILTETESELKERFWMKLNGEHLKEMEKRRKERDEQDEKDKDNLNKKKRRRTSTRRDFSQSNSAVEAMEKIIHEKRLSNKVNYDILKEIEQTASGLGIKPRQELNSSRVIEEVNDLVRTKLEHVIDTPAPPQDSVKNMVDGLSPDNLTKREKELARKNLHKPVGNINALKLAFKFESPLNSSTTPETQRIEENTTESEERAKLETNVKRLSPFMKRSRYGRACARPNLSSALSIKDGTVSPSTSTGIPRSPLSRIRRIKPIVNSALT